MRKSVLLLASMAFALLLASGVALAASIECPNRSGNRCVGTDNRDTMTGTNGSDDIRGRGGNDSIDARAGNDKLAGNDGDDTLSGRRGNDTYLFANGWGDDRIPEGGESGGIDTLNFSAVTHSLRFSLIRGRPYDLRFSPSTVIENLHSGQGRDIIFGNRVRNTISGDGEEDDIYGREGNDLLLGNLGGDDLFGGAGNDRLEGGGGDDRYVFQQDNWGNDTVVDAATDATENEVQLGYFRPPEELTQDLTVDLVSSPDKPEVINESGTGRINWSGNAITDVYIDSNRNDDTVEGNSSANDIDSYGGRDTISTGAGDDMVSVRDDVGNDVVDCGEDGPGITDNDTVNADTGDTLIDCETVNP